MADLRDVVAGNIRANRARLRIKQMDIGAALNLSQSATSALENGQRDITLKEALIVCRVLGIGLAKLLDGADPADLETFEL